MKPQQGFAMVLVLILLGMGGIAIAPSLSLVNTSIKSRGVFGVDIKHDYAAASAIEYGMWRLKWEPGYMTSLPYGVESTPFNVTVNGVTATTTVLPQAPPDQLSGQPLGGPANDQVYFKVTKEVVPTSIVTTLATDGFETGGGSGGTGAWLGTWTLTGDYAFRTDGSPYNGSYHLRLRGDDNSNPGDGYAQREVDLSASSGAGPYLQFWAKMNDLEGGDIIEVRVSTNGTTWTVLETFDDNDDDNTYRFHEYDLSSYGAPPSFFVSFKVTANNPNDTFWVDQVWFTNTQGTSNPQPGVTTQYTYYVTIQCMDPDGCLDVIGDPGEIDPDLEEIRDELPKRGAASGDYLQYIPNSVSWDQADWGIAPFPPQIQNLGSGASLQQELRWVFNPDVDFDYGEVKTMSFKAQAALTQGVYCNRIWARPIDGDLRPGTTAQIIVGTPTETRCSGGLLDVQKTVDTLIIYPNVPTTLTYTITIKNVDTLPIQIQRVEDYLPSTGVTSPTFQYVTNSTHAQIDRRSFPVLFHDGFNRSDNNTVLYWTDGDGGSSACRVRTNRGEMQASCAITQSSISTVGYTNIALTYNWEGSNTENSDLLRVEWKPSSSGVWNTLVDHPLNTTSLQSASWVLPATADNTTIDIRFTGITNVSDERARLDDVQVAVTPIAIAFDGFETGNGSGGTGPWIAPWTASGDFAFNNTTTPIYQGAYHLRLRGDSDSNPGDGYAERRVNLTGYSLPYLRFWARLTDFESGDTAAVKVSTNGTTWDTLKTWINGEDDDTYHFYEYNLSAYGAPSNFYVAFAANMSADNDFFYIDNVEFADLGNALTYLPVCMPDQNQGADFLAQTWWASPIYRWELEWGFNRYPTQSDAVWDPTGLCGLNGAAGGALRPLAGYWWGDYDPMEIQPGETLTIIFQATVTLTTSGSFYNEVFVRLENEINGTDTLYSWPTAGVTVPQVDLKAETLLSLLRANALFQANGLKVRSWHWKQHR